MGAIAGLARSFHLEEKNRSDPARKEDPKADPMKQLGIGGVSALAAVFLDLYLLRGAVSGIPKSIETGMV